MGILGSCSVVAAARHALKANHARHALIITPPYGKKTAAMLDSAFFRGPAPRTPRERSGRAGHF